MEGYDFERSLILPAISLFTAQVARLSSLIIKQGLMTRMNHSENDWLRIQTICFAAAYWKEHRKYAAEDY